jgi:DNA-directed RNA polymerase subunit K/omega
MSIQTVDLRKLKDKNPNIYEDVLVIAARAKQINADRIATKRENEILDDMDMYDETDIYDRELMKDMKFEKEINTTVIAYEQLCDEKLKPVYPEKEE